MFYQSTSNPLFKFQYCPPKEYLSLIQTLYPILLFVFLFHILHHSVSTRSLFIYAFQGKMFSYSFFVLFCVFALTCFAYYLVTEHLFVLECHCSSTTTEMKEEEFELKD